MEAEPRAQVRLPGVHLLLHSEERYKSVGGRKISPVAKPARWVPIVHGTAFDQWCGKANERWSQKAKECSVFRRADYYTEGVGARSKVDVWENDKSGFDKLMEAEEFLENKIRIDREIFQREVHERMLAICAHLIVGKDWQYIGQEIAKDRRGWKEWLISLSLFISAFRRVGKTSSIQQFATMMMCLLKKISIAVYSTGQRISRLFGLGVYKMICLAGYEHEIVKFTDELLVMASEPDNPIYRL